MHPHTTSLVYMELSILQVTLIGILGFTWIYLENGPGKWISKSK